MALQPNEKGGPYIFVSYSHTISGKAEEVIRALQSKGYRVWFDNGLIPGSSYNDVIAKYITDCEVFLCLLSEGYYESAYCKQEFLFAKEECKKPMIPVYVGRLEEIKKSLPPGIRMWLTGVHSIELRDTDDLVRKIEKSGLAVKCRRSAGTARPAPAGGTAQGLPVKPKPAGSSSQGSPAKPKPAGSGSAQGSPVKPKPAGSSSQGSPAKPKPTGDSGGKPPAKGRPGKRGKIPKEAAATAVVILLAAGIIGGVMVYKQTGIKKTYREAVELIQSGDHHGALEILKTIKGYKDSEDLITSIRADCEVSDCAAARVGDVVVFGTYEQDDQTKNGEEDIEWIVLAREDDRAFLLSRYALDGQPFNESGTDTTWETCSLREWLNSDFYGSAFDINEQQKIAVTECRAETDAFAGTEEEKTLGNDTLDKVFLPSDVETGKYLTSQQMICEHTAYTKKKCASSMDGNAIWMLRMPCEVVHDDTVSLYVEKEAVNDDKYAVRPAMWIDLS